MWRPRMRGARRHQMGRRVPVEGAAGLWNTVGRRLNVGRRHQEECGLHRASASSLRAHLPLPDDRLDIRVIGRQLARKQPESQFCRRMSVARSKLMRPCSVRGCGSGTWTRHASEQLQHLISSNDNLPSDVGAADGILRIDLGAATGPWICYLHPSQCIKRGKFWLTRHINEVFCLIRSTGWRCIVSLHASASRTSCIQ